MKETLYTLRQRGPSGKHAAPHPRLLGKPGHRGFRPRRKHRPPRRERPGREAAIRSFLADILPPDFGIDTGFVIDALGGISKQVDIVVYWKSRYPVLEVGGVKHFMIESVAAVFEIKADIGSEAVLKEALENIASVKGLDRTGEGRNRVMDAHPRPLDPLQTQDQVFGGIVTGHSMTVDNTREKMFDGWKQVGIGACGLTPTSISSRSHSTTFTEITES